MSDVLIKGMKMPKDKPIRIVLNPNGQLFVDHGVHFTEYEAVELPPHGRLIDADAMSEKYGGWYTEEGTEEGFIGVLKYLIAEQQTIIEADRTQND